MSRAACRKNRAGFTLIELLVVIAIIAILMAIIFPVFASVRENARQAGSMSNMHLISTRLEQFKLDNHKYPDVLFGYVYQEYSDNAIVPMDKALAQAQADYNNGSGNAASNPANYFPGLYPEYINDINAFTDPNNPTKTLSATVMNVDTNVLCPSLDDACTGQPAGTLVVASHTTNGGTAPLPHGFYVADAYDMSPIVLDNNKLADTSVYDKSNYVARYQTSWTYVAPGGATPPAGTNYVRQLRWRNPPSNTYVTCTTYHVPNANKVLVLWQGGATRKLDTMTQFLADGNDADVSATSSGVSQANFWKVAQNGP